jgi:alpha-galactosidase
MKLAKSIAMCVVVLLIVGVTRGEGAKPTKKKLQVFILAGQSNMVGHANYITVPALLTAEEPGVKQLAKLIFKERAIAPGAARDQLETRIKRDKLNSDLRSKKITGADAIASAKAEIKKLQAAYDAKSKNIKAAFAVSRRVYITSIADGHRRSGPLTVGYGGSPDKLGPELGFGLSLAQKLDAPILLIKTSWGGKSLHYNFRPPSAGPYELSKSEKAKNAVEIKKNAGLNYRMMNEAVRAVLKDLKKYHPEYDADVGHDIAGFVWFQGFNDQFSPAFRDNYKNNMIAFVKDVRKEYEVPKMPFVIGVMGTGVTKEGVDKNTVSVAQREAAAAPEFKGNVVSVESYPFYAVDAFEMFRKDWTMRLVEFSQIASDRPYHYMGSGKFFVRFGDALATAMVDLLQKRK